MSEINIEKGVEGERNMRTVEIVASYSGTVNIGDYNNESPFFSIKEIIEDCEMTDEEIEERHLELVMQCYNKFQDFKEEALKPLLAKGTEPDPKSDVPRLEELRQIAIELIIEQGKWFKENDYSVEWRVCFNETFNKDFDGDLQKLSRTGARRLNLRLGTLQHRLEKASGATKTSEAFDKVDYTARARGADESKLNNQ